MKRITFILALILTMAAAVNAQDKYLVTVVDSTALVADTTNVLDIPMAFNYVWAVNVEAWSLDATDATVTIQVANDTTGTWVQYADNSVLALNAASGAWAFEDDRLAWKYMRVITAPGSVTSGTYEITFIRVRRN